MTKLLDAAATPVYVVDEDRRLVWGNAAFAAWTQRNIDDLAGLKLSYTTSGELSGAAELAAALCPPPEAFSGAVTSGVVSAPAGGASVPRQAQFAWLAGESDLPAGLCVFVGPPADAVASQPTASTLHQQLLALRNQFGRRYHIGQLVGTSPQIRRVRQQVRLASQSRASVLVVGPPGSGREHVARTIHFGTQASGSAIGPLVPLDCSLLDAELMQSAITSFLRRRDEWKSLTRPGVLLLLELDKLSETAQQELIGFLRLPGVELPVMATAARRLSRLVAKKKFRGELACALSTLVISLPRLSRRTEDIPLLAQFFLEEANADGGKQLSGFTSEALDRLAAYDWPGNVEELASVVRQAHAQAAGPQVLAGDLPAIVHHAAAALSRSRKPPQPIRLDEFLERIEKELLERALVQARGNKTKAAQLLGIHRARLIRRLVQLGLVAAPATGEAVVFEEVDDGGPSEAAS
ncbi:MAG TPA: sigma 54-interacting transcriptional regulator [Pirellulaceae bacterium]|nr:sigma 54-interacting transcriptional regulator [Pirellulaceae bacterium]